MEDEWISGKVELRIAGDPLELNFTVPAKPVKLRRMLPVFQQMSDTLNEVAAENLRAIGKEISCRAGCAACCRPIVPLSEAEAFNLRDLIESMPEDRQAEIRLRFSRGMEKLNAISFFERFEKITDEDEFAAAVREYFVQQIACPFLENESCSIRESRPIACREYFVTSPPEYCSSAAGEKIENVESLLKVKSALIAISQNDPDSKLSFVPLIRMLEWSEDKNPDDSPELEGNVWMRKFFGALLKQSDSK